jgi:topoisomerase-4 subunit A
MSENLLPEDNNELNIIPVNDMFENWFLDYASYVILERAVPALIDGLKPVQRRIFHAMKEMDDGRYNKVANIIGSTMQYHPHGDASINDAIVNLGQKDLMIDCQGNWGDIRTGDSAAAPRYIEARLSKFALEVSFNANTTEWQLSYDGRKNEPIHLPMKFPLLLAQGAEGIAVGLSTKVMPHNFNELIDACIAYLKNEEFVLYPDFLTGAYVDCRNYNDGKRGGKIRVRAKMEVREKKFIAITEIPFSTTTTSLIESIIKASEKGKIKIKKVVDNTAKNVEILIELQPGISPNVTMDALYAFSDCEVSISPNTCVIFNDKPMFLGVTEVLKHSTDNTVYLLKRELEIKLSDLEDKWHFSSLEKIFIENRIYRDIEECETWEAVIEAIDKGLEPFKHLLIREVTREDIIRLTEIKIKRISKFDAFKADELLKDLEKQIKEVKYHLKHLTQYAIDYYTKLKEKYGKGRERKTELLNFEQVEVKLVAANNEKLYVNRQEGFVGFGKDMKKEEYVKDCSDINDVICVMRNGTYKVVQIKDKIFVGKDIIHVEIWDKGDTRMTYNCIYLDGKSGNAYAKRFNVTGVTRDKEYDITQSTPKSKILYFSVNPNGEAETVTVTLSQGCTAKKKIFEFNFSEIAIKGRSSQGNTLTKYPIRKVEMKSIGISTLGQLEIWYDEDTGKINKDKRGVSLGKFDGEDKILALYKNGDYQLTNFDVSNRFIKQEILELEKFDPEKVLTAVHYVPSKKCYYVKRFKIEAQNLLQKYSFISDEQGASLLFATMQDFPVVEYEYEISKDKSKKDTAHLAEIIDVKGWKAVGNKLIGGKILKMNLVATDKPVPNLFAIETVEEDDITNSSSINEIDEVSPTPPTSYEIDFEITNLEE